MKLSNMSFDSGAAVPKDGLKYPCTRRLPWAWLGDTIFRDQIG